MNYKSNQKQSQKSSPLGLICTKKNNSFHLIKVRHPRVQQCHLLGTLYLMGRFQIYWQISQFFAAFS